MNLNELSQNYLHLERGESMVRERRDIRKNILMLADVRRGTFYAHFWIFTTSKSRSKMTWWTTVCRLLEKIADNIIDDPYPQVLGCIQFLMEHAETIRSLSLGNQNGASMTKYKVILKEGLFRSSHSITNNAILSVVDACIVGAVVEGGDKIIRDIPLNAERIARINSRFISRGIKGMIQ